MHVCMYVRACARTRLQSVCHALHAVKFCVSLIPTTEVVSPGNTLGPGQIYDSNRTMLLAALRKEEYCAVDAGIATDRQGHTQ